MSQRSNHRRQRDHHPQQYNRSIWLQLLLLLKFAFNLVFNFNEMATISPIIIVIIIVIGSAIIITSIWERVATLRHNRSSHCQCDAWQIVDIWMFFFLLLFFANYNFNTISHQLPASKWLVGQSCMSGNSLLIHCLGNFQMRVNC